MVILQENRENLVPTVLFQATVVLKEKRVLLGEMEQGEFKDLKMQGPQGEKGQEGNRTSGVKYVRWGRTTCPNDTEIVYKGKNKTA